MSSASKDTKYNAIKGAFVRGDSTFRNWIKGKLNRTNSAAYYIGC